MALAYEQALGQCKTMVTSRLGTSQDWEVLTLWLCSRQRASQEGVYWVVRDSESARYKHSLRADIAVMVYNTSMRIPQGQST